MKLCLNLLSNDPVKSEGNFNKIAEHFTANNELIAMEYASDIFNLRDQIKASGCKYEKIIVMVMSIDALNLEEVSVAITDIAANLSATQSIIVCSVTEDFVSYLSEALLEYEGILRFEKLSKKAPSAIYNAVFGVNAKTASKATVTAVEQAIRDERKTPVAPAPVPSDMPIPVSSDTPMPIPSDTPAPVPSDMPIPVPSSTPTPVVDDTPLEQPEAKSKKKFSFPWKRGTKAVAKNKARGIEEPMPMPMPVPVTEEPEPMPIPVSATEEPEPMPIPVTEEPESIPVADEPKFIRKLEPLPPPVMPTPVTAPTSTPMTAPVSALTSTPMPTPVSVQNAEAPPVFIDDSMFTTPESEATPIPVRSHEPEALEPAPVPQQIPAPTPVPEQTVSKKSLNKRAKPPKMSKEGLSMQVRPRIIYVTGTGRIGQSTITASLGFTAAQYCCNSLIVDMDMIKRAISCIYPDYTNSNSQQSMGLIAGIRSPHLVDQIAQEHYNRVSTLGISIAAEDNRAIAQSVTVLEVQALLLQALTKYNVVIVDMPWWYLMKNPQLISIPHDILFCTSNDVMTMLSDLNQLTEDAFNTSQDFQMLISKLKFVLNMTSPDNAYEGSHITEKNFTKICYNLTEEDMFRTIPVLANIPTLPGIGNQVSMGRPASAYSKEMDAYCAQILHELK